MGNPMTKPCGAFGERTDSYPQLCDNTKLFLPQTFYILHFTLSIWTCSRSASETVGVDIPSAVE